MANDVPDAADRRRSSHLQRAVIRLRSPRLLVFHAGLYLVVNGFLVVVWLLAPEPTTVRGLPPGDDVGGIAVHIAARVMANAAAGEVLVSRTVHDLVTGSDYVLEDRGAHSLRGMTGEWQLFAVRA